MRKVTRKSLDELARVMPVISEESQKMYVGGTSGYTGTTSGYSGVTGGYTGIMDNTGDVNITGFYNGNNYGNDAGYVNMGNQTGSTGVTGSYISGYHNGSTRGSSNNPYTEIEYEAYLSSGTFPGGYVKFKGMDFPSYIKKDAEEVSITGNFPVSVPGEVNNIMYQSGYEAGFEKGLNDDGILDHIVTGAYYIMGTITPNDLRGSDYDQQKSFWGAGFVKGYQQGIKERERRNK